ncbi:hypothetical protein J0910_22395 [Nocardiopsis sp. CNT-189]
MRAPALLPPDPPRITGTERSGDGVQIRFASGHTVGVPADAYLGGR